MAESHIKDGNYYVVQWFMVKELALKGVELGVYAIIYGFSQNNQQFDGSRQYLADWCCASKQSIDNALKSLCEKGLLEKSKFYVNGVAACSYRAVDREKIPKNFAQPKNLGTGSQKTCLPQPKNLGTGNQKTFPNIIGDITDDIIGDNTPPQPPKRQRRVSQLTRSQAESFARFWEIYPRKVAKESAEKAWAKIDPPEHLVSRIILAVKTQKKVDSRFREVRFTPHPATWLNGREWENTYETGGEQNGYQFKPSTGFGQDF